MASPVASRVFFVLCAFCMVAFIAWTSSAIGAPINTDTVGITEAVVEQATQDQHSNTAVDRSHEHSLEYSNQMAEKIMEQLPVEIRSRLEGTGFITATIQSFLIILVTELGDKTFFIAAILAMRFSRIAVLSGALGALYIMTILSAMLGKAFPLLFDKKYTSFAAAVLFAYFGLVLLRDAYNAKGDGESDELKETEEELSTSDTSKYAQKPAKNFLAKFFMIVFSPIFLRSFSLTFLAEWGDRSQIATIALAAAKNVYGVTLGGVLGHTVCTTIAVLGGRLLAARISEKVVAFVGGLLFLAFAVLTAIGKLD